MSSQNLKVIYSLRIHLMLQSLGFNYLIEMRNPANTYFNCWVYEATPELLDAFNRILIEREGYDNG